MALGSTLFSECLANENLPNILKSLGHRPRPRVILTLKCKYKILTLTKIWSQFDPKVLVCDGMTDNLYELTLQSHLKVRVKLRNFADLDFDLDPNWGVICNNIEDLASK